MTVLKYDVPIVESPTVFPIKSTVQTAESFSIMFALEAMIAKHMDLTKGMRTVFIHPVVPKHFFTKKDT